MIQIAFGEVAKNMDARAYDIWGARLPAVCIAKVRGPMHMTAGGQTANLWLYQKTWVFVNSQKLYSYLYYYSNDMYEKWPKTRQNWPKCANTLLDSEWSNMTGTDLDSKKYPKSTEILKNLAKTGQNVPISH